MADIIFEDPALAALYDVDNGWGIDRDFYIELAGKAPIDVLDIGCGTGMMCNAYASLGHRVAGLDPARAMLDVARATEHGDVIDWYEGVAEAMSLSRAFDLIIMTGHAFQVLLDEETIQRALDAIASHLKPGGRFAFESRNPEIEWEARWHERAVSIETEDGEVEERTIVTGRTPEFIHFEHHYHFPDGASKRSKSTLRFSREEELRRAIEASGLGVERLFGGWERERFDPRVSEELIFITRRPLEAGQ